ncbi:MAG: hypothetical protein WCI02_09605 [Planctomycetota bacterium]
MKLLEMARASLATLAIALGIGSVFSANSVHAQGRVTIAKEIVEQLTRKFSKEVADEGTERLTARVQSLLAKVGDDGAEAIRQVGPRAIRLIEEAGEDSMMSARLLAKHGDEAVWAVETPARRALISTLGEGAGESLIRHGSIAEKLLVQSGEPAVGALQNLTAQNGRRLAMLAEEPTTSRLASSPDLLTILGRYGDRGMDFVWRNKGALAAGTALAVFVSNPEPFIDGSMNLAEIAASQIAKPIAEQIGANTQWTPVLIALIAATGFFVWLKWPKRRSSSI